VPEVDRSICCPLVPLPVNVTFTVSLSLAKSYSLNKLKESNVTILTIRIRLPEDDALNTLGVLFYIYVEASPENKNQSSEASAIISIEPSFLITPNLTSNLPEST